MGKSSGRKKRQNHRKNSSQKANVQNESDVSIAVNDELSGKLETFLKFCGKKIIELENGKNECHLFAITKFNILDKGIKRQYSFETKT